MSHQALPNLAACLNAAARPNFDAAVAFYEAAQAFKSACNTLDLAAAAHERAKTRHAEAMALVAMAEARCKASAA